MQAGGVLSAMASVTSGIGDAMLASLRMLAGSRQHVEKSAVMSVC
jgi:hypothetical protein